MMGFDTLQGIEYQGRDFDEEYLEVLWEEMLESELIVPDEEGEDGGMRISDLGQFIINTAAEPEICIHIANKVTGAKRTVYVRNYYYMFIDERDEVLSIDLIPTIDLILGAIAEAIETPEGKTADLMIEASAGLDTLVYDFNGEGEGFRMENGTGTMIEYDDEVCLSELADWMLKMMRKGEEENE
jgi:hypothetical protein